MTERGTLDSATWDLLFREARTHNGWQDRPVERATLREAFEIAKMGPTSANCSPLRIVFVDTPEGKARLMPSLSRGNQKKTEAAPVTAIMATDHEFYEHLPRLFPHDDARAWFVGSQNLIDTTAFRNATLQAAYFMIACRGLGLDCGPMSGFDNAKVDEAFFAGTALRSNFLCNVGYGDAAALFQRSPRFDFEDVCSFA